MTVQFALDCLHQRLDCKRFRQDRLDPEAHDPVHQFVAEARQLASCYRRSLAPAKEHGLAAVAFPSISTDIYGYPVDQAAGVALEAVKEALAEPGPINVVRFVLFDAATYSAYERALAEVYGE